MSGKAVTTRTSATMYRRRIDYNFEYRKYVDMCSRIPSHLLNKVRNMPNNKGFIWNGIYLFGHLPPTRERALILFERRNNRMYIHEIREGSHKITEQEFNNNNNNNRRKYHKANNNQ